MNKEQIVIEKYRLTLEHSIQIYGKTIKIDEPITVTYNAIMATNENHEVQIINEMLEKLRVYLINRML